ncbi:hypothetical protein MNBD_IGNAVI01-2240 [hydrothermal vent metagenome]|uniref:Transposase IS200-like domain-containing protein n=1 Tax=hydrothermal vent metagenome TaxID=652676 RepID=A0A3B1C2H5_9ZZZZ
MDKARNFYKNTYHHLYNRGTNKTKIFFDDESYLYFLRRLKHYKNKYHIQILAYCLMPNHFHIFVKQQSKYFTISDFLSNLLNSYVKSINKKFDRKGSLFESKTKNKLITDEHYFVWIIKYILENPVKAKLANSVDGWEFSNAKDLLGERNGTLTDVEEVKSFFQSEEQMMKFLTDKKIIVDYEF